MMHSSKQEVIQLGLKIYLKPEVIRMTFLGFSAGLPHPLLFASLSAWLASVKISMTDLTMFAWVGIIYAIKFLWAPILDNVSITYLSRVLGQRRSWILLTQILIFSGLLFIPNIDPQTELGFLAMISIGIAIASASQDIAIDAYRVEIISNKYQGAMGASYQLGYRISYLFSAAGALYLADYYSWKIAYQALAPLMLIGVITVLFNFFLAKEIYFYLYTSTIVMFIGCLTFVFDEMNSPNDILNKLLYTSTVLLVTTVLHTLYHYREYLYKWFYKERYS